ncbi:MAG: ABC transporter ATP-binding protein [Sarcina sp.]
MIEVKNVIKSFKCGQSKINVLNGIDIVARRGELIAIVGPSGSGKTTLLNILGLLEGFDSGKYLLFNKSINDLNDKQIAKIRNEKIGFVVQNFALINDFSVYENLEIPLEYSKISPKERRKKIDEVLNSLNILDKKNEKIFNLSGGQAQRVAIARAIINNPELILADEPTGSLDSANSTEVINLLKKINETGKTVIIITHDLNIANSCTRVIKIFDGHIEEIKR